MNSSFTLFAFVFLSLISIITAVACPGYYTYATAVSNDCTSIAHDLTIDGSAGDLSALSGLTYVGGDLTFEYVTKHNLSGLENLAMIGEDLTFFQCYLRSLDGLTGLTFLGSSMRITNCQYLTNVDGLSKLETVSGAFSIINNAVLENLDGFSSISNANVGLFHISNNNELLQIDGLSGIIIARGTFLIENNPKLTSLDGLSGLTSIGGYAKINFNNMLPNVDSLSSVTVVDDLLITNNAILESLSGLSSITRIRGNIVITNNALLMDVDFLANILTLEPDSTISLQSIPHCSIQVINFLFSELDFVLNQSQCEEIYCLPDSFGEDCGPCNCVISQGTCNEGLNGTGCVCDDGFTGTNCESEIVITTTEIEIQTSEEQSEIVSEYIPSTECIYMSISSVDCDITVDDPIEITEDTRLEDIIVHFTNIVTVSGSKLESKNSTLKFSTLDLDSATFSLDASTVSVENNLQIKDSTLEVYLTTEEYEYLRENDITLISYENIEGEFSKVTVFVDNQEISDYQISYDNAITLHHQPNNLALILVLSIGAGLTIVLTTIIIAVRCPHQCTDSSV